jgi:predicted DNA-binding transcriptional regulator YafY
LRFFIAEFGVRVKVVEPEEFVQDMRATARAIAEAYES